MKHITRYRVHISFLVAVYTCLLSPAVLADTESDTKKNTMGATLLPAIRGFSFTPGISLTEYRMRLTDARTKDYSVLVNQLGSIGLHLDLHTPRWKIGPLTLGIVSHTANFGIYRQHVESSGQYSQVDRGSGVFGLYSYLAPVIYFGPLAIGVGYGVLQFSGTALFGADIQESTPKQMQNVGVPRTNVLAGFIAVEFEGRKNIFFSLAATALRFNANHYDYSFDEGKLGVGYRFSL